MSARADGAAQSARAAAQDQPGTAAQSTFQVGHADITRVALLTNPAAGKGSAADHAQSATQQLNRRGIDVVHLQGPSAEASRKLAAAAIEDERVDALVVCGGDGLINLALQEQAQSGMPLGIIPSGTGNDHAREYNIPLDPKKAADVIADGFWSTTDLGMMTSDSTGGDGDGVGVASGERKEMWFGTIACAGFDSLVSDRTNRMSWPKGRNRYNLAIAIEFLNFRALPTRLVLEPGTADERVIEQSMMLCAMGNTRSYGGGMKICPDANHHDGLLDITVMGEMSRGRAALKFGKIFSGNIRDEAGLDFYRARKVRIEMTDGRATGGAGGRGRAAGNGHAAGSADAGTVAGAAHATGGAGAGVGTTAGEGCAGRLVGTPINGYSDGDAFGPLPMTVEIVPGAGKYLVPRP